MEKLEGVVEARQGYLHVICLREDENTLYVFYPKERWGRPAPVVEGLHIGLVILPEGKREIIDIQPLWDVDFESLSEKLKTLLKERGFVMTNKVVRGERYKIR